MDEAKYVYYIQQPLAGATTEQLVIGTGWHTVARACTAEGAGEVVRALCGSPDPAAMLLRVEIRREL